MKLYNIIKNDLLKSFKNGNVDKKNLLRSVIGECDRKGKELDNTKCISIIKQMIKNAKIMKNENEIKILNSYLPSILTGKELTTKINDLLFDSSKKYTFKDIMQYLKSTYNNVDMKYASIYLKKIGIK
jgi:uncharacterized protein YqeY